MSSKPVQTKEGRKEQYVAGPWFFCGGKERRGCRTTEEAKRRTRQRDEEDLVLGRQSRSETVGISYLGFNLGSPTLPS